MKAILLYTNDLVDIINIPLESGGFTKQFYIVEKTLKILTLILSMVLKV